MAQVVSHGPHAAETPVRAHVSSRRKFSGQSGILTGLILFHCCSIFTHIPHRAGQWPASGRSSTESLTLLLQ
jgi:hypothetical protein